MENQQIILEKIYDARVEKVWQALTDIVQMQQWFFPMMRNFEPKIGFSTQFDVRLNDKVYPHLITVTESIPDKTIAYTWRYGGYPGNSVVRFALEPIGDQTKLMFTQTFTESSKPISIPISQTGISGKAGRILSARCKNLSNNN
jgi:uncharacterized protein YndB with AHSA1/START domain